METEAAVLNGPTDEADLAAARPVRVETVEVATPGREEVLVDVAAASLCHTDVSIARGEIDRPCPLVMGHEGAGIVHQIGEDVQAVSPGDHVVLGRVACGTCEFCRRGRSPMCTVRRAAHREGTLRTGALGFRLDGTPIHHCHSVSSFSEYTIVTEEVAVPITRDVPLEEATLLGCGVFTGAGAAMNTADVEPGSSVVVFGGGGVGLSAVQGAALRGAADVIVVDVVPEKLDIAARVGATHTVEASSTDPVERILEIAPDGVDYAIDAVGSPAVAGQAVAALAPTGTAVLVGTPGAGVHDVGIDLHDMVTTEKTLRGSFNGSYNLQLAIPMLAELVAAGKLALDPLITDTKPLEEVNEAMASLETGTGIRQVILP